MPDQPEQRPRKKLMPLRHSMVMLLLVCWVLPILLLVAITGVNATQQRYEHTTDIITASVENATDIICRDLNSIIGSALNISYVDTVRSAYSKYLRGVELWSFHETITHFLTQQFSRRDLVRSAYMLFPKVESGFDDETSVHYYTTNFANSDTAEALQFYSSGAASEASAMLDELGTRVTFFRYEGRLYLVRVLSLLNNSYNPYAVLVIDLNEEILYSNIQNLDFLTDVTLYIGEIPLLAAGSLVPKSPAITQETLPVEALRQENNHLLVYGRMIGSEERFVLDYYAMASLQPLMGEVNTSIGIFTFIAILTVPLVCFIYLFFRRKVTHPIKVLGHLACAIEDGGFGAQLEPERLGSTDLADLGTRLNAMSARLKDQFERIYREELALRDARIKAMQSQINPHFLGNTLEIINWEARLAGNVKVSRMLEALSTMLEAALDRRHRPLVHLSEELMYVNAYLLIIGERLGKRLEVRQEIDESLLDWYVPRLILQPLVENAVEHGAGSHQKGLVIIRAKRLDKDRMCIEVINDGPMSPEDEQKVAWLLNDDTNGENETALNIGIRNVHQRLRMLYGPDYGLSIKTDKNEHTVSSFCIQNKQEPQENPR